MKHRFPRLAAWLLAAMVGAAAAAPLDDMRRLVDSGQFEQAVMLAQRHPELIGDVHFDFLYGVAAISAGRVPEGLLALERHLAAVPANDRARMELARGYFLVGEWVRARAEFEFVLRYNPTPGTRRTIESFLNAMQLRSGEFQGSTRLYADAGLGYDNNVNLGSRNELVAGGGEATQPLADSFAVVALGSQFQARISPRFSVFAGADAEQRVNARHRDFDLGTINLNAGFTQLTGSALVRFALGLNALRIGGERYRDALSAGGEVTWSYAGGRYLNGSAQFSEYRHSAAEMQRDARVAAVALTYSTNWPQAFGAPQAALRLGWTGEYNSRKREDLSRDILLLRAYGALSPTPQWRLNGGLTAYGYFHRAPDLLLGSTRQDSALILDLVATYALDPRWSLRAEWQSAWTRSNHDQYDSDRHSLALKTRYQY
jgi:hypothetical protein